jgi:CheY-like chemotaxis protein
LCDRVGSVAIELAQTDDGGLRFVWTESGGPKITSPPVRRGFGSIIIERSIPFELKGETKLDFAPEGLRAVFTLPPAQVHSCEELNAVSIDARSRVERDTQITMPADCLVVEDNMIIAMDAEAMLRDLGARNVHVVADVHSALQLVGRHDIGFGLLDVNLGDETSTEVAAELKARDIPFVFASGYGEGETGIADLFGATMIQKPFTANRLHEALKELGF